MEALHENGTAEVDGAGLWRAVLKDGFEPGEPIEDVSRESRLLSEPP